MKSVLFGASVLAVFSVMPATAAPILQDGPRYFADAREAERNMPEAPARCTAAGAAPCVSTLVPVAGPDGLQWVGFWAEASMHTECVDSATAVYRVDCDAPDAVRVAVPPAMEMCTVAADRSRATCTPQPRPGRPYRPTPQA